MGIKVISQTTAERKQEIIDIFNECKPYLDEGDGLIKAVKKAKKLNYDGFKNQAWYRELREYAKTQGYMPQR